MNRLSVGVQALVDDDLKRLGRQHTAEEALAAFDLAARTFDRVSFDMIYARSRQTVDSWRSELSQALQHAGEHMSLYQLTIEPDTRFADLFEEGKLTVPQDEEALAFFDVTQEMTDAAGLPAYEISNHARPGAECRHNLIYWNYGEYAGVGPGAHSRLRDTAGQRIAIDMQRTPEIWRGSVEQVGHGTENTTCLSAMDAAEEYLLMGLRLTSGIQAARYKELAGAGLNEARLETLVAEGLLERREDSGTVRATARGKRVLNAVIAYLAGS